MQNYKTLIKFLQFYHKKLFTVPTICSSVQTHYREIDYQANPKVAAGAEILELREISPAAEDSAIRSAEKQQQRSLKRDGSDEWSPARQYH